MDNSAGSTQFLGNLDAGALNTGATFTILDAATCREIGTLPLTFQSVPDPLVIISETAPPTTRALTSEEQQSRGAPASASPFTCGGAQAWQMVVVNNSAKPYYLSMLPPKLGTSSGPQTKVLFDVPSAATGSITWAPEAVGVEGPIDLLDPLDCTVLDSVTRPGTGSFVLTIDTAGSLALSDGEIPDGTVPLHYQGASTGGTGCVPRATPTG